MKKFLMLFAAITIVVGFTNRGLAQTSATVSNTSAGAVLLKLMTLNQVTPLHFGSIFLNTNGGGTVTLPSNSTDRVFTGGVLTSSATPLATNAAYNVTGTRNETYVLTLPNSTTVTHTLVGDETGENTMEITDMTVTFTSTSGDPASKTSALNTSGNDSFTLGGTLTVKQNQLGGIYAGTFSVTVDYN